MNAIRRPAMPLRLANAADPLDAEFRDIFELSCEKGFRAIIDEAEWHFANEPQARTGFVEKLAVLANHFERAMVTFLDHSQFWKGATRFYHADTLPYWRKRKNSATPARGGGRYQP